MVGANGTRQNKKKPQVLLLEAFWQVVKNAYFFITLRLKVLLPTVRSIK